MLAFSGLNTCNIDAISVIYDVKKEKKKCFPKNQMIKSRITDKARVDIAPSVPPGFIRFTKTKADWLHRINRHGNLFSCFVKPNQTSRPGQARARTRARVVHEAFLLFIIMFFVLLVVGRTIATYRAGVWTVDVNANQR